MQRRHNCSLAASFANCVMTLYLLEVHLKTFLSIPISQKCQILSCDPLVANERYVSIPINQPTRCNSLTSLLLDVYVWLNMFRAPLRPSSGTYNYTRSLRQNSVSVRSNSTKKSHHPLNYTNTTVNNRGQSSIVRKNQSTPLSHDR